MGEVVEFHLRAIDSLAAMRMCVIMAYVSGGQLSIPMPRRANCRMRVVLVLVRLAMRVFTRDQKEWMVGQFHQKCLGVLVVLHDRQHLYDREWCILVSLLGV